MTCQNKRSSDRGTQQSRYRAVASWRQKIDVEALAQILLMMALHRADQEAAAIVSGQADQAIRSMSTEAGDSSPSSPEVETSSTESEMDQAGGDS